MMMMVTLMRTEMMTNNRVIFLLLDEETAIDRFSDIRPCQLATDILMSIVAW